MTRAARTVLLALSADPQPLAAIAENAGVPEAETRAALQQLTREHLAIAEDDGYELTGPLSWFGDFSAAIRYHARKKFYVTVPGEPEIHLYLCDVRVKGMRRAGDPLNEAVSVFACGRTARDVSPAAGAPSPTCTDCRDAATATE